VKALGGEWHEECFCCTVPPPLPRLRERWYSN
jgi:hypothetical protein